MDVVHATLQTVSKTAIRQGLFTLLLKGGVSDYLVVIKQMILRIINKIVLGCITEGLVDLIDINMLVQIVSTKAHS